MRYTAIFRLNGTLAKAVAVEWTASDSPEGSSAGWEACVKLANGDWRFSSHTIVPDQQKHWRGAGVFSNIGLRYRLQATGPWSPVSASRKEITLVDVTDQIPQTPPALTAAQWSALEAHDLGKGLFTAAFELAADLASVPAVEWTVAPAPEAGDAEWQPCAALGDGRWRLAGIGYELAAGDGIENLGLRYRLVARGVWSAISQDRKALSIAPAELAPIAPLVLLAPSLLGSGKIGSELNVATGLWSGLPAPILTLQWQRDGVDIPGATEAVYRAAPEDDRCKLGVLVRASNLAGVTEAVAGPVTASHIAPKAAGMLLEEIFDQGSGVQKVPTADDFTGEALRFAVSGAGAQIDATTGEVDIPTDKPVEGAVVTVAAHNSGGSAESAFAVTVEAVAPQVVPPAALKPEDWDVSWDFDPTTQEGRITWHFEIKGGPARDATRLYWSGRAPLEGAPGTGFHACIKHPTRPNVWIARSGVAGVEASWLWVNSLDKGVMGQEKSQGLIYTLDAPEVAAEGALYSDYSDVKTRVVTGPVVAVPPLVEKPAEPILTGVYQRAPYTSPAKARVSYPPSDVEQVMLTMARSASNPDRIYAGQDVGGVWVSTNNGRKWNTLRNRGLGTPHILSLEVDPLDANRVLAVCFRRVPKGDFGGLYRTLDGGLNWSYVHPWGDIGEPRGALHKIAFAPSSTNGKFATRWYAAFDSEASFGNSFVGDSGFVTSADGGETWSPVRSLPAATFGTKINGIRVHPTTPTVVYGWGSRGLFRFNDALRGSGTVDILSGTGGLPTGSIYGDLYISRDGKTLVVGLSDKGIYKSTNGGSAWSLLYAWPDIEGCFVNTGFPDQIYAVSKNSAQVRVSKNGGASWITNVQSEPMPGEYSSTYQTYVGRNEPNVLPDPRNKNRATGFANAKFFQTDNGGENWLPANDYFCGAHHKSYAAPQCFDPKNPLRYVLGMLDIGIIYTEDGGRTFEHPKLDKAALGLTWSSVNGIALHPVASERIILACAGRETKGVLIRSTDNGANWSVASAGNQSRHWIGFDAGNPTYCYQWRERSTNKGASWTSLPTLPSEAVIVGISRTPDPETKNSVLYATRIKPSQNPSPIWRSRDRGDTWQEVIRPTWKLSSVSDQQVTFRVHPTEPFTVFTRSANRQIRRWKLDAGGKVVATTDFDFFNGGSAPGDFDTSNFAIDTSDPAVMYARNSQGGSSYDGNFLFMTKNAGANWTNISEGFSNAAGNGLEVHPITGVVYIGTTNGMYVRKAARATAGVGTFELLATAYPRWETAHINQAY